MKHFLIILIYIFVWSCDETKEKSKELFTADELKLIEGNQDYIEQIRKTHPSMKKHDIEFVLVSAFKAAKIDTTKYRNVHFHFKGWKVDYFHDHDVYDSLLNFHYGIKTMEIEEHEYLVLLGAKGLDSMMYPIGPLNGIHEFKNIVDLILKKNNYRNDSYYKAYWEEREISFNKFKDEVRTRAYRKKSQDQKWKESANYYCESKNLDVIEFLDYSNSCDEFILKYCAFQFPDIGFAYTNALKPIFNTKILGKIDTTGLVPLKIDFDSLGNLKSVITKNEVLDKKLLVVFEELSGIQKLRFLNRKSIGFSFTFDQGDINYLLTEHR